MSFNESVPHLEIRDFDGQKLRPHVHGNKPVIVMMQGSYCGHCTTAKPAFAQFAQQTDLVNAVSIQIDGQKDEQEAYHVIRQLIPNFRGVPTFVAFDNAGNYVTNVVGGQTVEQLQQLAAQL